MISYVHMLMQDARPALGFGDAPRRREAESYNQCLDFILFSKL